MPIVLSDILEFKNNPTRGVVEDTKLIGGYTTVADATARDAIDTQRRKEGMLVFVLDTGETFRLASGLTNSDWSLDAEPFAGAPDVLEIYVSTAGNDLATGTAADPIATLWEATIRSRQPCGIARVYLGDGDHATRDVETDFGAGTFAATRFGARHPIELIGQNQTTGIDITVLSWGTGATANVASISETLTVDELVGHHIDTLFFSVLLRRHYVISNTANTVTFGISTISEWGSTSDAFFPPTGVHTVTENAARIVQPAVNPDGHENQLFLSGTVTMKNITVFHGTAGFDLPAINLSAEGTAGGNKGRSNGYIKMEKVMILGANKAIHAHGVGVSLTDVLMDGGGAATATGFQGEMGGNLVTSNIHVWNVDTGFIFGADFIGEVGVQDAMYAPNVNDVFKVRKSGVLSITMSFIWTSGNPQRYCDSQGDLNHISFSSAVGGFQQQGTGTYSSIFFADAPRALTVYQLSGSATAAPIGTPVYVGIDGESFTLAEWNALATNVQTANGSRVTDSGKSGLTQYGDVHFDGQTTFTHVITSNLPTGTTQTIDFSGEPSQDLDLNSASGNVTVTVSGGIPGTSYVLRVIQGATARTIPTWTNVDWGSVGAPVLSVTDNDEHIFTFWCIDGTSYIAGRMPGVF